MPLPSSKWHGRCLKVFTYPGKFARFEHRIGEDFEAGSNFHGFHGFGGGQTRTEVQWFCARTKNTRIPTTQHNLGGYECVCVFVYMCVCQIVSGFFEEDKREIWQQPGNDVGGRLMRDRI